jgi:hypothetical protein
VIEFPGEPLDDEESEAMIQTLQYMLGWLGFLVSAAGLVVTALHFRRSRWGWLLVLGFGVETGVSLFYRLPPAMLGGYGGGMQAIYLLMSLVGLAGRAALVGGVAGVLLERGTAAALPPPFVRAGTDGGVDRESP